VSPDLLTFCAVLLLIAYILWAVNADRREERVRQRARDRELRDRDVD
jgi:hypothetical protein